MIVHASNAFSKIMSTIGWICGLIVVAFVYMAYFRPDELATVAPQIVDGVRAIVAGVKSDLSNL